MKTPARLLLLPVAGLSLAGCATPPTATTPPPPAALAFGEQPLSSRDYWLKREYDDKIDRALESPAPR